MLVGKRGLVVGIANEASIAFGCAMALRLGGARLAVTYLNQKAEPYVRPLADQLEAELVLPLNVQEPGQLEAVFEAVSKTWGKLDFLVHSIAYCPMADLHARVVDTSLEGFLAAMDVSCHSLLRMIKLAEPLMSDGGAVVTMTYHGAEKVVPQYNIMGPVKAALEATVRYAAVELGRKQIRVHAISPGPIYTRASSGIAGFDDLANASVERAPLGRFITTSEIGRTCAFLVSDAASGMTGQTHYVDGGANLLG